MDVGLTQQPDPPHAGRCSSRRRRSRGVRSGCARRRTGVGRRPAARAGRRRRARRRGARGCSRRRVQGSVDHEVTATAVGGGHGPPTACGEQAQDPLRRPRPRSGRARGGWRCGRRGTPGPARCRRRRGRRPTSSARRARAGTPAGARAPRRARTAASKRERDLLVVAEPEPGDGGEPIRRERGERSAAHPASARRAARRPRHASRSSMPSLACTRRLRRVLDLGHLDAQSYVDPGRHRVDQAPVAADRQVAEEVPVVLELVAEPAQRVSLRRVRGVRLDVAPAAPAVRAVAGRRRDPRRPRTPRSPSATDASGPKRGSQPVERAPGTSRRPGPGCPSTSAGGQATVLAESKAVMPGQRIPGAHRRCRPARRSRAAGSRPGGGSTSRRGPPAEPARSTVCSRPPIRSRASSTTHSTPAWVSALATVSPAIPRRRPRRARPARHSMPGLHATSDPHCLRAVHATAGRSRRRSTPWPTSARKTSVPSISSSAGGLRGVRPQHLVLQVEQTVVALHGGRQVGARGHRWLEALEPDVQLARDRSSHCAWNSGVVVAYQRPSLASGPSPRLGDPGGHRLVVRVPGHAVGTEGDHGVGPHPLEQGLGDLGHAGLERYVGQRPVAVPQPLVLAHVDRREALHQLRSRTCASASGGQARRVGRCRARRAWRWRRHPSAGHDGPWPSARTTGRPRRRDAPRRRAACRYLRQSEVSMHDRSSFSAERGQGRTSTTGTTHSRRRPRPARTATPEAPGPARP